MNTHFPKPVKETTWQSFSDECIHLRGFLTNLQKPKPNPDATKRAFEMDTINRNI